MGAVAVCMVSPRTVAFTLPVLVIALIVSHIVRERAAFDAFPGVVRLSAAALTFGAFALLSSVWAEEPIASLTAGGAAFAWLLAAIVGIALILTEPRHNEYHLAEGLWIGLMAGLAYLLVEILSEQAIKIFLYNALHVPKSWLRPPSAFSWAGGRVVAISPFDLTRSIAPVALLLWPALLCLRVTAPRNNAVLWGWLLYALAVAVIMVSEHETSKVAIVVASLVFMLSRWNATAAAWLLRIGWVTACLAVIPVALSLYRANFHTAPWLQLTAQHRIIIWNNTAEHALKAPVAGIGAGMMYQLDEEGAMSAPGNDILPANARHAHNVFLQTWFELGAIGAALLALFGLSLIEAIQRSARRAQAYGHAMMAAAMCLTAASYGMWQAWFLAMFALAVICYTLAVRVNARGA